jgi:hypothetical protein
MLGAAVAYDRHPTGPLLQARGANELPGALGQLEIIIDRLAEIIDEETAQLHRHAAVDLRDFNDRKSQGLLELTRAMRQLDSGAASDIGLRDRLSGLRAKLESNQRALKLHLEAVREISTIVSDAIRDADSDGTYSPSIRNGGRSLWSD